jgi:hypothetical protein
VETAIQLGFRLNCGPFVKPLFSNPSAVTCAVRLRSKTRTFAVDANRESCRRSKGVFP